VECGPTFGVPDGTVVAVVAGGEQAAGRALEEAEDDLAAARADLSGLRLSARDVVVGITASGRTPFVVEALAAARAAGACTVAMTNNAGSAVARAVDHRVELLTGPEVVATSATRSRTDEWPVPVIQGQTLYPAATPAPMLGPHGTIRTAERSGSLHDTIESSAPRTRSSALRQAGVFLAIAFALALALPRAGIAPLISMFVPVIAVAITVLVTLPAAGGERPGRTWSSGPRPGARCWSPWSGRWSSSP
jgi:hypothetical protein